MGMQKRVDTNENIAVKANPEITHFRRAQYGS